LKTFREKVAVVTGAGSGIGRALATSLAQHGAKLALTDINSGSLEETVRIIDHKSTFAQAGDIADPEHVAQFARNTAEQFGVVHQVYNNAGMAHTDGILNTSYRDFARVLNVNLWGVIQGTREFLPHIIDSGDGHIINVSSLNGLMAYPYIAPYVTSKFAVRGFSETLQIEMLLHRLPVKVTTVYPAGVKTNIAAAANNDDDTQPQASPKEDSINKYEEKYFYLSPETCAQIILKAVDRGKTRVCLGQAVGVDRLVRLFPQIYPRYVVKHFRRSYG
jgi:short-subunit dehydrogenase